jgi:hypothetical protein
MLIAAALAIWKGWEIHRGETAVLAYGLGALALAMGAWHLMSKAPPRRKQIMGYNPLRPPLCDFF